MSLIDIFGQDYFQTGCIVVLAILTLVQITPIKINPWTAIINWFSNKFNGEINSQLKEINASLEAFKETAQNLSDKIEEQDKKIDALSEKIDANEAIACRTRIVRFGDDLYQGMRHAESGYTFRPSKEHFDHILIDITNYRNYCKTHPNFENNIAEMTIKQIKEAYEARFISGKF